LEGISGPFSELHVLGEWAVVFLPER